MAMSVDQPGHEQFAAAVDRPHIGMRGAECLRGGGIGRNSALVRSLALEGLACLGLQLDPEKNAAAKGGMDLSATGSPARIYVVDTNEELMVAQKARALLLRTRDAARKGDTL